MKRMIFGAACAALIASASPALAQTMAVQVPSPHRLELAKEVIAASGVQRQMSGMFGNMMNQMMANATKNVPPSAKARVDAFTQAETDVMVRNLPKIVDVVTNAYATTYTDQELTDILAFYQSPSGQAMTAKAPQMAQNMMGGIIALMPQIQHDVAEEACAKITCTPAEKHAFGGGGAS